MHICVCLFRHVCELSVYLYMKNVCVLCTVNVFIYLCVCVYIDVFTHECACLWRTNVNAGCSDVLLTPELTDWLGYAGWPGEHWNLSSSASLMWDYRCLPLCLVLYISNGDWTQGIISLCQALYQLSPLLLFDGNMSVEIVHERKRRNKNMCTYVIG